jgi:nitrile hydratase accessory protein
MHEQGLFTWEEFRDGLVREIGQKQAARSWSYYECWLAALERLLEEKRLAGQREIEARATELEQLDDHG